MKYRFTSLNQEEIYSNICFEEKDLKDLNNSEKSIDFEGTQIVFREVGSSLAQVCLMSYNGCNKIEITGAFEGAGVGLCYLVNKSINSPYASFCPMCFVHDTNKNCQTDELKSLFKIEKEKNRDFFLLFLSSTFIDNLNKNYPEVYVSLLNIIKKQLFEPENSFSINIGMNKIIEEIKKCGEWGNMASYYFETKIQELLALQIQQMQRHRCENCFCFQHYRDKINKARLILEQKHQKAPTIRELSALVGMSETLLKAGFKSFFGTTIYGYHFNYRMNIARELLRDSSLNITDIAEKTGYEHQSHFTTAFKRRFGISPMEFRKKIA